MLERKSAAVCLSQNELFIMDKLLSGHLEYLRSKKVDVKSRQYRFSKRFRRKVKRHLKVRSCDYVYNAVVFVNTDKSIR